MIGWEEVKIAKLWSPLRSQRSSVVHIMCLFELEAILDELCAF